MWRACATSALASMLALMSAGSAAAHTVQQVGRYTVTIGWLHEPTYVGEQNAVQFLVHDASGPVDGISADDLKLVVSSWETVPSDIGGLPDLFSTNLTSFGDFGVIDTTQLQSASATASAGGSAAPSATPTPSDGGGPPWILIILIALGAAAVGWVWGDAWDSKRH